MTLKQTVKVKVKVSETHCFDQKCENKIYPATYSRRMYQFNEHDSLFQFDFY